MMTARLNQPKPTASKPLRDKGCEPACPGKRINKGLWICPCFVYTLPVAAIKRFAYSANAIANIRVAVVKREDGHQSANQK
jgi:hypothetical protein